MNKQITVCCAFCPVQPVLLWIVYLSCDPNPEQFVMVWIGHLYLYEWAKTGQLVTICLGQSDSHVICL